LQLVVLDRDRAPHDPHEELLSRTLSASADDWEEYPSAGFGQQFRVFRRRNQSRLDPLKRDRLAALQQPD